MRSHLWLLFLLIPGVWRADAAETPSSENARAEAAIAAHIQFLADDLLEGRGTGTPGHEIAARYVAAQLQQWGVQPGGDSGTWFQPVPLIESRLVEESARLELRPIGTDGADTATHVLSYAVDYLLRPSFFTPQDTVSAPLIFAGFGVRAPEQDYDDLAELDLRGKIAVVLAKAPPRFPSTALAHHASARVKASNLVERGAIGIVVIPTPKDLEESPWPRQVNQSRFASMTWLQPDGTPGDGFPELQASASVSPAGAGKLFSKAPRTLAEVLAAANQSKPPSFPLNLQATISRRSEHRRLSSPNVIGVLPGSDPALAAESVILTAHLDHQGRGPAIRGDAIYNGAYDNAIGIAMMLEAARTMATQGSRPRRTMVFAAVTAEEKGLRGSEYLARHLPPAVRKPVANINLDMVLVTRPTRRFTVHGIEHSSLRDPVESAASRLGLELVPDPRPERVTFVRSDQYSFIRHGVPAIFPKVADIPGSEAPGTGISPETYIQEHYHRPSDDLTLPRDAPSSVLFTRFMTDVARQVADADEAPRWNPGDFFGETFGPGKPASRP